MEPFVAEVDLARRAQLDWAARPVRDRLRVVREARFLLVERRHEVTAAVEADLGRAPGEVTATDLLPTAAAAKWLCDHAESLLRPRRVGQRPFWLLGCRDTLHRRPRGVVGLIGTWNYPVFLNAVPLLHAFAAGNGVVWKPSELTPLTAAVVTRWLADAGVPPGLLVTLPATRDGGARLAESAVDFVHFTGSDAVGRKLAARLGERLIPSALELSGCDALVVLADADLRLAARSAWYAATLNAGQTCLAARRLFVHESVREAFLGELRPLVSRAPAAKLATPGQLDHANGVLAEAESRGCELLRGEGHFAPTLIVGAMPELRACREALFAPVASLLSFADEADLLRQESACPFALGASVFTRDAAAGHRLAGKLRAGAVTVNDVVVPTAHPATPFGGRGASGWGVTQGAAGLLELTAPQVVTARSGNFRPHLDGHLEPTASAERAVGAILTASHGRTAWARLRGAARGGR